MVIFKRRPYGQKVIAKLRTRPMLGPMRMIAIVLYHARSCFLSLGFGRSRLYTDGSHTTLSELSLMLRFVEHVGMQLLLLTCSQASCTRCRKERILIKCTILGQFGRLIVSILIASLTRRQG